MTRTLAHDDASRQIHSHVARSSRRLLGVALLAVVALVAVGLPAVGVGAASPAHASPAVSGGWGPEAAAGSDERARLIVEMDLGSTVPRGGISALPMDERRAAVASRIPEVAAEVARVGGQVTATFDTRPYLAVSVATSDLPALTALPGVASVALDEVVTLHLDDSLPPIGAAGPVPSYLSADLAGSGSAVAVIDTGVDREHGFFAAEGAGSRVVAEACFSAGGDCAGGMTEDTGVGSAAPLLGDSHGTHVAGIAAGGGPGGSSPAQGVAPLADIVAVQAFSVDGDGKLASYVSDLAKSLEFVLDQHVAANGIEVAAVNLSLGTTATDTCNAGGGWNVFSGLVDDLRAVDVLTIAAAGNGGNHDAMGEPACLDNVVSVGATDSAADIAWFSDLSAETDLVAPGVGITSAVPGGGYAAKSGTSMATPHVAGALALLRGAAPVTPWAELLPALVASETLVDDDRTGGVVTGLPFLDLPKALTTLPGHPDGPAAPAAPTVSAGDSQVTVDWTEPQTGVEQYDVISRPGGHTCQTAGSATSCTIGGLDNGTGYTFTVIASNSAGPGPSSPASKVAVPAGPPSAPTNVLASAELDAATVSWDAPTDDGGSPIVEYAVTSDPEGLTCTSTEPDGAPDTNCVVDGLDGGTPYTFTVTASNGASISQPSEPSSAVTPNSVPGAPTGVTATDGQDGHSTVSWVAPVDEGTSPITSYRATSTPDDHSCVLEGDLTAMSCEVDGLTNGSDYAFTITATNKDGTGPASAPSATITPVGPPGAPTELIAVAGDQQVELSWTPPDSDGGEAISGYEVSVDDGTNATPYPCDATTSCTVSGLANGTAYTFTVRAENGVGVGPASAPTPQIVPATVPDPPTEIAVSAGNPETAVVSWTAPSNDGGGSILEYTATSDPDARTCTATEELLTCTVTGLTGGQAYTFTVIATNARGDSVASTKSAPFTPDAAPSDGGGGGGGGGGLPPPEEPVDEDDEGPITESDGSLPSQEPGTSTLLIDGEPASTDVTGTDTSVIVSGSGFTLSLSPKTSTGESAPTVSGTRLGVRIGGRLGVTVDGLEAGSTVASWLFSDPVLLGTSPVASNGRVNDAVDIHPTVPTGDHTLQIAGVLADGRSIAFNLGIEVTAAVGFADVDPDSTHGPPILRLAELGIVSGFTDGTYGPDALIDRGQMAAFLQRALRLDPGAPGAFDDVTNTTHELSIGAIADADIASGFDDGTYRPHGQVTRGQMATFLGNATGLTEVSDGPFTDIDGNTHAGTINAVAAVDIASGYPDGTYRPGLALTRAQMASLISRMLDHLQAAG